MHDFIRFKKQSQTGDFVPPELNELNAWIIRQNAKC